jgi:hypothetical protein
MAFQDARPAASTPLRIKNCRRPIARFAVIFVLLFTGDYRPIGAKSDGKKRIEPAFVERFGAASAWSANRRDDSPHDPATTGACPLARSFLLVELA